MESWCLAIRIFLWAASCSAGPAFEGGNIRYGIAGVPGAIDTVTIFDNHPAISTISNKKPIGICGTGVIETVYELVKEKIVDNTGLIADKYFDNGYPLTENISFTNKDIREVQLAKSAIRAGIEILVTSYGIDYSQIAHLYLAGGLGKKSIIPKLSESVCCPKNWTTESYPSETALSQAQAC